MKAVIEAEPADGYRRRKPVRREIGFGGALDQGASRDDGHDNCAGHHQRTARHTPGRPPAPHALASDRRSVGSA
jgi:hypothetical protein